MGLHNLYLFRHVLLRDVAYKLQPPSERAESHWLAVEVCLHVYDDTPPEYLAPELAEHLKVAMSLGLDTPRLRELLGRFLDLALKSAQRGFRLAEAIHHADAIASLEWLPPQTITAALLTAAEYCDRAGQRERGANYVKRALELLDEVPSAELKFRALMLHATICIHQGNYPEAEQALTALTSHTDGIPEHNLAVALGNLAIVHREIGRNDLAENEYRLAIEKFHELGEAESEGRNLGNLANILRDQAKLDEAGEAYLRALQLVGNDRDPMTEGIILNNYAGYQMMQNRYNEAEQTIYRAQKIQLRLGDTEGEFEGKSALAKVFAHQGKVQLAITTAREAVVGLTKAENPFLAAGARISLASYLAQTGELVEAQVEVDLAEQVLASMGAREMLHCQVAPLMVDIALSGTPTDDELDTLTGRINLAIEQLENVGFGPESESAVRLEDCRQRLAVKLNPHSG